MYFYENGYDRKTNNDVFTIFHASMINFCLFFIFIYFFFLLPSYHALYGGYRSVNRIRFSAPDGIENKGVAQSLGLSQRERMKVLCIDFDKTL